MLKKGNSYTLKISLAICSPSNNRSWRDEVTSPRPKYNYRVMKQLLLVLVLIMFPVLAQSATYYVAQSGGNNSNPGSQSAPFQTIQKCANVAGAGDTCLVRAGTYRETVRPANSGVTFAPDGNASVTVS